MKFLKVYGKDILLAIFVLLGCSILLFYMRELRIARQSMLGVSDECKLLKQYKHQLFGGIDKDVLLLTLKEQIAKHQIGENIVHAEVANALYRFQNIEQDVAMRFLVSLTERFDLPIEAMRIEKHDHPGRVNMDIQFQVSEQQ